MQMRTISAGTISLAKTAATLVAAAAALLIAAPSVQAQVTKANELGAIRLGVYVTTNSNTQTNFGRYYFSGGLDYDFQQPQGDQRDIVSVDYVEYGPSGKDIRIIPVTIGQQSIEPPRGQGVRPYVGYGIGAYFVHLKAPLPAGVAGSDTTNNVAFGGYLNAGLELGDNLFVDARYHIMTPTHSTNTDGLELTAGVRF